MAAAADLERLAALTAQGDSEAFQLLESRRYMLATEVRSDILARLEKALPGHDCTTARDALRHLRTGKDEVGRP